MIKKVLKHIYLTILLILIGIIVSLPLFNDWNNSVLDRLQGNIDTRPEIVIIKIDDDSLNRIGAWPWERSVFAKAINNLETAKPKVVGIDVLFLESRPGDSELSQSLSQTSFTTVLGSKVDNNSVLGSQFSGSKITNGLIDFRPDSDGAIRSLELSRKVKDQCQYSFSLAIFNNYLSNKNLQACQSNLNFRNQTSPNNYQFLYSRNKFKEISFIDLYENKVEPGELKDKIVLVGSTALDLKSNLSDNFQDVFGNQISGVKIHANVINSLLQNRYQQTIPNTWLLFGLILLGNILLIIYSKIKNTYWELAIFLGIIITNNLIGIILFDSSWNWNFLLANSLIFSAYIFYIAYKYLVLEKESRLLEKAFSRYVNPKLLSQIKENPQKLKLGGEKKEVTILFSDIRGFTTFSEKLIPEELITLINDYLTIMTDIILKNDGTVDKYIGDAIMAFWGAPVSQENQQILALKTVQEMKAGLAEFNRRNSWDMKIGLSLNTGDVIVGNVGSQERFNYTILGDNVNLGSRLEGLTKKYSVVEIVAGSVIQNLTGVEGMIFRLLDEMVVKGRSEAIRIYEPMTENEDNLEIKVAYEKAFMEYQKGNFPEAVEIWSNLKNDGPSQVMIQRVEKLTTLEKQSWDGIWRWTEK